MNRKIFFTVSLSLLILLMGACRSHQKQSEAIDTQVLLQYCVDKVGATIESLKDSTSYPRNILAGQTEWNTVDIHDWTSGFWPGILWYAYEASGDSSLLAAAQQTTEMLTGVLDVPVDNHDLGFMFYCSYGNGYRLTGNEAYADVLLRASDSLATLYNPVVGTILSWPAMVDKMGWPHNTIIDNMINLEMLFWAAKKSGNQAFYDLSVSHAKKTLKANVRNDFSTFHVAVYDTISGDFIKGVTHQGYSDSSLWARGQAWAIYGYTMCYRQTQKPVFLQSAQKLVEVYLKDLPEDGIPYWDFKDPSIPDAPKDASAAAVVASALLDLSTLTYDTETARRYTQLATKMLGSLSNPPYLAADDVPAILQHSTGHWPHQSEIDVPIIYADYYYMEALIRLKNLKNK